MNQVDRLVWTDNPGQGRKFSQLTTEGHFLYSQLVRSVYRSDYRKPVKAEAEKVMEDCFGEVDTLLRDGGLVMGNGKTYPGSVNELVPAVRELVVHSPVSRIMYDPRIFTDEGRVKYNIPFQWSAGEASLVVEQTRSLLATTDFQKVPMFFAYYFFEAEHVLPNTLHPLRTNLTRMAENKFREAGLQEIVESGDLIDSILLQQTIKHGRGYAKELRVAHQKLWGTEFTSYIGG